MLALDPTPGNVRRLAPVVQAAAARDLVDIRREARDVGREDIEDDIDDESLRQVRVSLEAADMDEAAAFVAAAGLAAAWGMTAQQTVAAGSNPRRVVQTIDSNIDRTAATETARALNDERERMISSLAEDLHDDDSGDGGSEHPKRTGIYKIWSAILDGRTCNRCFAADGETVEATESFSAGSIPMHPRCRCIVQHLIVPKPERLEDISFDYDLFKREVRDLIREGREGFDRPAFEFAAESMGDKRSPRALDKRFYRLERASTSGVDEARRPRGKTRASRTGGR